MNLSKRIRQSEAAVSDSEVDVEAERPATNGEIETKYKEARGRGAAELEARTGWSWDTRELSHFFSPPISTPEKHKIWRRQLIEKLSEDRSDSPNAREIRSHLDMGTQRAREVCRVLAALFADRKPIRGKEVDPVRSLERLDLFRELQSSFSYAIPEQELISPLLRRKLFGHLGTLSAQTCSADEPFCDECEVARFCHRQRTEFTQRQCREGRPTVVDLFCGAGGMSAGFDRAGFQSICVTDLDPDACRTFTLNNPGIPEGGVINADITDGATIDRILMAVDSRQVQVLTGGPPCQGFSRSGFRSTRALRARRMHVGFGEEDDERNYLFEFMIEVADRLKPNVVLMENVPGMDSKRGEHPSFMQVAKSMLDDLGYSTVIWDVDAASYGVPQHRLRKFLVASRAVVPPALPEPDYTGRNRSMNNADDLLKPVTLNQAIADLPELGIDDGEEVMARDYRIGDKSRFLKHYIRRKAFPIRTENALIYNHRSRYNNDLDVELFSILSEGENGFDAVHKHGRSDLMRYRKDAFHDKYFRMQGDLPSRTIVSHLSHDGNGYIHPSQTRTITPREGARLQSFPDNYVFCGSASSQWRQIGNAVPPLLAYSIAKSIREHLKRFFD
jgi:DNA (cytosine-5)-methyltransferase 1